MKIYKFLTVIILLWMNCNMNHVSAQHIHAKGYAAMDDKGQLVPYEFERRSMGDNDLLVEILYCGICHSDVHDVFNDWGITTFPTIPGHEMVGKVTRTGKDVSRFKVGDYVGVGATVIPCGKCETCQSGKEQFCADIPTDEDGNMVSVGGYSDKIVIDEHFGIKIPADAPVEKLGPLMCAGITVYSPLKAAGIKKGDKVAIAGFGGLGHLAVQYAVAFGAEVTVFDLTEEKRPLASQLGAVKYVNVTHPEEMEGMNGTFDYILTTITTRYEPVQYLNMLKTGGELLIVGLPANSDAPDININAIPFGTRISKWLMGGIPETQEVMDFSIEHGIYPMVEVIPIQQVNEAFQNVKDGKVHFRYVIDMKSLK